MFPPAQVVQCVGPIGFVERRQSSPSGRRRLPRRRRLERSGHRPEPVRLHSQSPPRRRRARDPNCSCYRQQARRRLPLLEERSDSTFEGLLGISGTSAELIERKRAEIRPQWMRLPITGYKSHFTCWLGLGCRGVHQRVRFNCAWNEPTGLDLSQLRNRCDQLKPVGPFRVRRAGLKSGAFQACIHIRKKPYERALSQLRVSVISLSG